LDHATVSGSRAGQLFTLYESSFVDASTGTAALHQPLPEALVPRLRAERRDAQLRQLQTFLPLGEQPCIKQ
jgi:hypothetical protein